METMVNYIGELCVVIVGRGQWSNPPKQLVENHPQVSPTQQFVLLFSVLKKFRTENSSPGPRIFKNIPPM